MLLLQVSLDTAIAVDKVKMVKKISAIASKVYTASDVYEINMPYEALVKLLNSETSKLDKIYNILKEMGTPNP